MRIFEIMEPQEITVDRPRPFDTKVIMAPKYLKHQAKYHSDKELPIGKYSQGRTNIQDPHSFTKITSIDPDDWPELEDDAYYQWVKAISPYVGKNSYLPNIRLIKLVKDSEGRVIPKYQIEQLFTLEQLAQGDEKLELQILRHISRRALYKQSWSVREHIMRAASTMDLTRIKDPDLRAAIRIIDDVSMKNFNFVLDLHYGNFMYRNLGSYGGVQLVITDPLA